jgi:hypothetical protein
VTTLLHLLVYAAIFAAALVGVTVAGVVAWLYGRGAR